MFQEIESYILSPLELRRAHLFLDESCIEIGGTNSRDYRGLLAHFLKTTIPAGRNIHLCHACHNAKCSNPKHLYWGTPKENHDDQIANGSYDTIKNRMIQKYGLETYKQMVKETARKARIASVNVNSLSQQELDKIHSVIESIPVGRGRIGKIASKLSVSHTQVRRYMKRLNLS